jgi:hypothetical protein
MRKIEALEEAPLVCKTMLECTMFSRNRIDPERSKISQALFGQVSVVETVMLFKVSMSLAKEAQEILLYHRGE